VSAIAGPRRPAAFAPIKRVVVPLDTSDLAEIALPPTLDVARGLDLPITLVLAIPTLSQLYLGTELVPHPEDILKRSEAEAGTYLMGVSDHLAAEGTKVSWKVLHGDPARAIVDHSGGSPENLITMATHGHSGLGRWVLGSVTDKVVRTGTSPVLVVRP